MRRNKKSGIHKERIIMLASSAFVLAALTMTGVYMMMAIPWTSLHLKTMRMTKCRKYPNIMRSIC